MAPKMPPTRVPTVRASSTMSACRLSVRPMMIGCRTLPSIWFTTMIHATTARAMSGPLVTRATRAATTPAMVAPITGMKAVTNTSTASGTASGTPKTSRNAPISTASTRATNAVPRT